MAVVHIEFKIAVVGYFYKNTIIAAHESLYVPYTVL